MLVNCNCVNKLGTCHLFWVTNQAQVLLARLFFRESEFCGRNVIYQMTVSAAEHVVCNTL